MGVAIRRAQRDDLAALLALYRELNPDDPPLAAGAAEAVWKQIQSFAGRCVLLADTGSRVVGTLDCHVAEPHPRRAPDHVRRERGGRR